MKRLLLYSAIVLGVMFICLGYSESVVIKTFQLPVTNIYSYNNVSKLVTFIYIPSKKASINYKCEFTINCGKIPFGISNSTSFELYPNEIKRINITIANITKPVACQESVKCTPENNSEALPLIKDVKITVLPFFETIPDQLKIQVISSKYWYINKPAVLYLVNNYSESAVCEVSINDVPKDINIPAGAVIRINYHSPLDYNIVTIVCKGHGVKYSNTITTTGILYHKLVNLSKFVSVEIKKTSDGFNVSVKNKYNQNVVCLVSVYDSKFNKKYIETKNVATPGNNSITVWTFKLKDLGLTLNENVKIGVSIVCSAPYTTKIKKKEVLSYTLNKTEATLENLRQVFFNNILKLTNLYTKAKKYGNKLQKWNCGDYKSKLNSMKHKIDELFTEYLNNKNNITNLKKLISNESELIAEFQTIVNNWKKNVSKISKEFYDEQGEFLDQYYYVTYLYQQLIEKGCISKDSYKDQIGKIYNYFNITEYAQVSCPLLKKLPTMIKQAKSLNETLQSDKNKCSITPNKKQDKKSLLKKIKDLYNKMYDFKNKLYFAYNNNITMKEIILPVISDVSTFMLSCYNLENNLSTISYATAEKIYNTIKNYFEQEYTFALAELSSVFISQCDQYYYIINSTGNEENINKFKKFSKIVEKYFNKINELVKSNEDLIKNNDTIKKYFARGYYALNEIKNLVLNDVEVIVNDTYNESIPLAEVYVNGNFVGLTNGDGILDFSATKGEQVIEVKAPGYKETKKIVNLTVNNQLIRITLKPLSTKEEYPPLVKHFVNSTLIFEFVCSTLKHPHCTKNDPYANWTLIYLHPHSEEIENLTNEIPKSYIVACKTYNNCLPLLEFIIKIVNSVIHYNNSCISNNATIFNKYCMAWWGSDYGILEYHTGVCADFARLTVSLLRSLGIPARYVRLVAKPTKNAEKYYGDAFVHALTQVYINGHWVFYDTLWKFIKKPIYPLSCVKVVASPYLVKINGKYHATFIDLIKQMSKYYPICPGINGETNSSSNIPKPPLAAPINPSKKFENYSCIIFLQNKTVACQVNDTDFSVSSINFNNWINITHIYKGVTRSLIFGTLNNTTIESYVAPGSKFNLLICGLNNSTVVAPGFVAINKSCVFYTSRLPGLFKTEIAYPPFFYSSNVLVKRVALLYGYLVINNSTLAKVTDMPVSLSQMAILGSINQELATLYIIKKHSCPSGISVLNNLNLDNINNILLNKPDVLVLVNTTDTHKVEHSILSLCRRPVKFKVDTNPRHLYPDVSRDVVRICLMGINYMHIFV